MKKRTCSSLSELPYRECSLEKPGACHFCQIHQDESSLTAAAIRYLQLGAVSGENLVMLTSAARQALILDWLMAAGVDVNALQKQKRLFVHSSQPFLDNAFEDGRPRWDVVESMVSGLLREASWHGERRVRFYGDAVSDLWTSGNHAGAVAFEEFWTRLKLQNAEYDAALFCGYVIDALSPRSYSRHLDQLGRPHNSVMSCREGPALARILDRAGRDVLGITLSSAESRDGADENSWRDRLPAVFRSAMWLKKVHPSAMTPVLERARSIYAA